MFPVAVAYLGGMIGLVTAMVWAASTNFDQWLPFYVVGLALFLGWLALMVRAGKTVRNVFESLALALLAHLIMAVYVAGVVAIFAVVGFGVSFFIQSSTSNIFSALIAFLIASILFYAGRRGEIFMASRCIREYLRRQSRID